MKNGALRPGRAIVTGAAGLIGSAVLWRLNLEGFDDVIAVDRLGRGEKWRHLVPLRFVDYLEADTFAERIAAREDAFGDVATVIHLGACSSTTERDARYLIENNYGYSQAVATWALRGGARFVYASSAATYGAREHDLREDLDPSELRPLNMYGYSKELFDRWARREGVLERAVGLKFFNVFGPDEDHKGEMRSVVAKAYEQIAACGEIELFSSYREGVADGEQSRDFVYVKDAAAATLHLARDPAAHGLYNLGTGRARTWNELARAIFAALGRTPRIRYVEMPEVLRGKYQYRTEADTTRLRGAGFDRWSTLEDAVADYVRRYLVPGALLDPAIPEPAATPATIHQS